MIEKITYKTLIIILGATIFIPLLFGNFFNPAPWTKALIFNILVELASLFYLALLVANQKFQPYFTDIHILFLIIVAFISFSLIFALDPQVSFWGEYRRGDGLFFILHTVLYFFILTWVIKSKQKWWLFLNLTVFAGLLVGILALGQKIVLVYPSLITPFRIWSITLPLGNPNFIAHFCLILIPPTLYLAIKAPHLKAKSIQQLMQENSSRWRRENAPYSLKHKLRFYLQSRWSFLKSHARYFYFSTLVILILSVFSSNSLTGQALLVLSLTLILIFLARRNRKFLPPLIIFLASGLTFFLVKNIDNKLILEARSLLPRLYTWKIILIAVREKLLTGYGWFNMRFIYDKFYDLSFNYFASAHIDKAHNIFLEYLATTGILGCLSFVVFWLYILIRLIKKATPLHLMFFSLFALNLLFLLLNFLVTSIYIYLSIFLALAATGLPLKKIALKLSRKTTIFCFTFLSIAAIFSLYKFNLKTLSLNYQLNKLSAYTHPYSVRYQENWYPLKLAADKIAKNKFYYFSHQDQLASVYLYLSSRQDIPKEVQKEIYYKIKQIHLEILKEHPLLSIQYPKLALNEELLGKFFNKNYQGYAEYYYQKALALNPRQGAYQFELARFYLRTNRPRPAISILERLVQTNYSKEARFYLGLGKVLQGKLANGQNEILHSLFNWEEAKFNIENLRKIFYPDSLDLGELERVFKNSNNQNQIIKIYQAMLRLQPDNFNLYSGLIQYHLKQDQSEKAKKVASQAAKKWPDKTYLIQALFALFANTACSETH